MTVTTILPLTLPDKKKKNLLKSIHIVSNRTLFFFKLAFAREFLNMQKDYDRSLLLVAYKSCEYSVYAALLLPWNKPASTASPRCCP